MNNFMLVHTNKTFKQLLKHSPYLLFTKEMSLFFTLFYDLIQVFTSLVFSNNQYTIFVSSSIYVFNYIWMRDSAQQIDLSHNVVCRLLIGDGSYLY